MHTLPGGPAAATPLKVERNNEDGRGEVDYAVGRLRIKQVRCVDLSRYSTFPHPVIASSTKSLQVPIASLFASVLCVC